ncbi:MAG: RtcB family protein [Lachnospiraceae bacterium]|jgi:RNA-splicing ligase RtcB|nr:RtcB family protein [uncultured Acetatifactor sp.]MCI9571248.1 RtcB family protein [Lachnospiraceae bacterium]
MKTVKGIYAEAKIFTDDVEEYAQAQVKMICDHQAAEGSRIRLMPDIHPGKVGPIGLSMTATDKVIPQLLGVDIGCGMTCVKLNKDNVEFQKLDRVIRENVPSGFAIRKEPHHMAAEFPYEKLHCARHVNRPKAERSLGTLGGGNHFLELDRGEDGGLHLVVHTGSRHLGEEVAEHYTKLAYASLKEQGLEVPYYMSYLEGDEKENYTEDVQTVQDYAELNRQVIVREILKGMKWKAVEQFSVAHNYLDASGMLRKGAIAAEAGVQVIIPANMRDGMILGIGLGNEDWNCSAPHGSGRRLKREDVKSRHTVSDFKKEMKGIYSSCVGADTLDEAPFAYRSLAEIAERIRDTVQITEILKPVYNYKAGSKEQLRSKS